MKSQGYACSCDSANIAGEMNNKQLEQRLTRLSDLSANPFLHSLLGIEKESLRVNQQGTIAKTPHPVSLGAALTHPYITTDYSEALLELITPPIDGVKPVMDYLQVLHKFVYDNIQDESIWATSMPCVVEGEAGIPIAEYGSSNIGRMKNIYRRGLGHRYGKIMQVIAGVHYNYSMPEAFWPAYQQLEQDSGSVQDFINRHSFGQVRNIQRYGWLIPYLFGASPAVCKSFLAGQPTPLLEFNENTYYEPFATSLRMGDIGYTNAKEGEAGVKAIYDDVESYVESLSKAINTPYPDYEKIGIKVDGEYRQLNANRLQIENEYYSTVRPKQVLQGVEKPSLALKRRGVKYVELRSCDVNAHEPLGVSSEQLYFLEAFMIFCLLQQSPLISVAEQKAIDWNITTTAHQGRDPALRLQREGTSLPLSHWAVEICEAMQGICEMLDATTEGTPYSQSLKNLSEVARDPERTPSARMLEEMRDNKEGFYHFALRKSEQHREYFSCLQVDNQALEQLHRQAGESIRRQQEIEAADGKDFDTFLQEYFEQS